VITIGLPLAIWGEGYGQFLDRWLEGVNGLERKPDEIVVVTDEKNRGIADDLQTDIPFTTHFLRCADYRLWDYAIRQLTTDWLAICNVEDVFLPKALNELQQADDEGCDIVLDRLRVRGTNQIWSGSFDPVVIPFQFTMPGAEPMKRELYLKAGGFDYRFQFPDWAMVVHMVHRGLGKPYAASTERILFDPGDMRVTMSGMQQNPNIKAAGTAQVHELSRSLGLL
jgi:hypothetical protein